MSFVFVQKKAGRAPAPGQIIAMLKFGRWPTQRLVGLTEPQLQEVGKRLDGQGTRACERIVFDVLRADGKKQPVKQ